MKSLILLLVIVVQSSALPGLLKIPKVYNALITSDQNLTPSRAFPVIQPVVHRTALGLVPPLFYPQFAPQFVPEIPIEKKEKPDPSKENDKDSQKPQEPPLKFYPNYQTVLYEPYFYSYSGLGPQVEQANYQDYQPEQMLDPIPPDMKDTYPERLLPHLHEENQIKLGEKDKIPDVPPPPVPGSKKNNSP